MNASAGKFRRLVTAFKAVTAAALAFGTLAVGGLTTGAAAAPGIVEGREARTRLDNLTHQVYWFDNLRDAEASARQKGKPLLWMHILGKIDGAT